MESRPEILGSLLEGEMLRERDFKQARREQLAAKGHALKTPDGIVFPIESAKDAQNALTLYQSGHHDTPAAKAHILKNAKRVGASSVVSALSGS